MHLNITDKIVSFVKMNDFEYLSRQHLLYWAQKRNKCKQLSTKSFEIPSPNESPRDKLYRNLMNRKRSSSN